MSKQTLLDLPERDLQGRRILIRVDFNVPLDEHGTVTDATRIRSTLPTLRHLLDHGARVVAMSHLGRPGGQPDPRYSLEPVVPVLRDLIGGSVDFCPATVGPAAHAAVNGLEDGHLLLLENTRFLSGETSNDPDLSREMAALGDHYVNDAFGSAHRAHSSTEGVARAIRARGGRAVAGFLMEKELRFLGEALENPQRPFVAVMGGAKISGKIDVVEAMLPRVDRLLIGGAMANTFFRALGLETGDSLVEEDRVEMAAELMARAGEKLLLPVDCVVAPEIAPDTPVRSVSRDEVLPGDRIGDIGPESRLLFARELGSAQTIIWNGPMGVFEMAPFADGTLSVAHAMADAGERGALTVVGGGDSAAAVEAAEAASSMSHISTGGGASLEFLAGKKLPGVEALSDRED
jgi:phosphoglycerate kinase